ncbi:chloride channel protein [Rhodoplanes azumiensis]|uniref:Chloride channel protein n=1 Tax=Rhodoplanes azumiensis TaxID=1897628 RepID=A0ABW5ALT3_9BRAD
MIRHFPARHRVSPAPSEFEAPHRLRSLVRSRETALVVLGAVAGAIAGLVVTAMNAAVDGLHALLFGIPAGTRLSASWSVDPVAAVAVPCLGGLAFGIVSAWLAARRPQREIDPIEANALHGGRMSLLGSLVVAVKTVWSSGVGASVGLEAGYTQLAAGIASRLGIAFRLRRGDLRVLVGCGAAGGIAGAFQAPLAGAFYAFELVIGTYSVAGLAPVAAAAVVGYAVAGALSPGHLGIIAVPSGTVAHHDLLLAALLGLAMAGLGIGVMRSVAVVEALFVRFVKPALRPFLGGFLVGCLALITPRVLSSGHGALHLVGLLDLSLKTVASILALKIVASVVSLGAGFRGGLFFASLLMGALAGQIFAVAIVTVAPGLHVDSNIWSVVAMSALAATVVGGPLTMTFIALESTGDLWLTVAVLVAVIVAAQVTRETFGYSFATWRFHLRGETIRSAADVGWMRDLTVGRMMREARTVPADTTIGALRRAFPLGSTGQVVAVEPDDVYAGLVAVPEAHAAEHDAAAPVRSLLRFPEEMLSRTMTAKQAAAVFDRTEAEALAVVESEETRKVVGLLTEAYLLRRYSAELERRRQEIIGDG